MRLVVQRPWPCVPSSQCQWPCVPSLLPWLPMVSADVPYKARGGATVALCAHLTVATAQSWLRPSSCVALFIRPQRTRYMRGARGLGRMAAATLQIT